MWVLENFSGLVNSGVVNVLEKVLKTKKRTKSEIKRLTIYFQQKKNATWLRYVQCWPPHAHHRPLHIPQALLQPKDKPYQLAVQSPSRQRHPVSELMFFRLWSRQCAFCARSELPALNKQWTNILSDSSGQTQQPNSQSWTNWTNWNDSQITRTRTCWQW